MEDAASELIRAEEEKMEKAVTSLTNDWQSGQIINDLNNLGSDYRIGRIETAWVQKYVNNATNFFLRQELRDAIGKYEDFNPILFYDMFTRYILTITSFNSCVRKDITSFIKLDEAEPIFMRWDGSIIINEYFASEFYARIVNKIDDIRHYGMLNPLAKELEKKLDESDCLLFAKAMHYSLPLNREPLNECFKPYACRDGFMILSK